jgi:hypothetical protein
MKLKVTTLIITAVSPHVEAQVLTPGERALAQATLALSPTNSPGYLTWLLFKVA